MNNFRNLKKFSNFSNNNNNKNLNNNNFQQIILTIHTTQILIKKIRAHHYQTILIQNKFSNYNIKENNLKIWIRKQQNLKKIMLYQ